MLSLLHNTRGTFIDNQLLLHCSTLNPCQFNFEYSNLFFFYLLNIFMSLFVVIGSNFRRIGSHKNSFSSHLRRKILLIAGIVHIE